MHPALKATMATATVALLAATAGDTASARGRTNACAHVGRQYVASGTLADGSTLVQVAGAATKRASDDRYSGTLDVDVTQAPGKESALGLHAYVVTNVRLSGAPGGDLPDVGTRISLAGAAIAPAVARRCGIEEPTAAATRAAAKAATAAAATDDTTAPIAAVVTGVEIKSVRLGHGGAAASGKHASGDDNSGDATGDDDSSDDDSAGDQTDGADTSTADDGSDDGSDDSSADDGSDDSGTDDSGDGSDQGTPAQTTPTPAPTPQPTSPAQPQPTTPPATTPSVVPLPGSGSGHHRR